MDSLIVRYRNLIFLFIVLMAQILGLAVQVRHSADGRSYLAREDGSGVRLLRFWAESLVAPFENGIHSSKLGAGDLWQNYMNLRNVQQQNLDLQATIDRLRLEQASMLEDAKQGQRLQQMLGFQQNYLYSSLPAQIIGSSGSDLSRIFWINKGSDNGLKPDMAVVTADGIVGKVRDVFQHMAQVLVINDQSSGAGVILASTRTRGILRGNAAGQLEVVGIMNDARIQPGEKVLTAGGDLIFPRGLAVGVVSKVLPDPDRDSCILVMITPAAHLDRLDEVLVVTSLQSRFSADQQQDMAASETEKKADLVQLQEQKKASEIMAERLPGLKDPNQAPVAPAADGSTATVPGETLANQPAGPTRATPALHPDKFSPPGAQPRPAASEQAPAGNRSAGAQGAATHSAPLPASGTAVRPAATGATHPATAGAIHPVHTTSAPASTPAGRNP